MGVHTFVCRNSGGVWKAKQLTRDLEGEASSTFDLQRSLVRVAAAVDSSGGHAEESDKLSLAAETAVNLLAAAAVVLLQPAAAVQQQLPRHLQWRKRRKRSKAMVREAPVGGTPKSRVSKSLIYFTSQNAEESGSHILSKTTSLILAFSFPIINVTYEGEVILDTDSRTSSGVTNKGSPDRFSDKKCSEAGVARRALVHSFLPDAHSNLQP
ncbi:60S acidic ribosomal protein P3-1 [Platanthera zijinensis]|uniref:60S acidic ribosomal protein P3-1 n=1 Tax=Platanthera zijinensis TaxID=2320716 RepID=A0AAP0AVQ7_9ASPA